MTSVIVDDTDLSRLAYTSPSSWEREGAPPEYNSTTHGTALVGATVTFTFNGTSVGVFGSVSESTKNLTTVSTYQVDASSTVTYTSPVTPTHVFHQQFFQSPELPDGQHSLVITVTQADNSAKYWLDYLVYTPGSSGTSPTSLQTPIASTPANSDVAGAPGSKVGGGVIAAAVLVSVAAVLLFLVSILWWRRRKMRSKPRLSLEVEAPPNLVTPFRDPSPSMSYATPYTLHTPTTAPPSYTAPAPSYDPPTSAPVTLSESPPRVTPRGEKAVVYRIASS